MRKHKTSVVGILATGVGLAYICLALTLAVTLTLRVL